MELHSYLSVLRTFWKPILLAPLVAAVLALGATYIFTKYEATAKLLVLPLNADPRLYNIRLESGQSAAPLDSGSGTDLIIRSIIGEMTSRPTAIQTVSQLHLDQVAPPADFLEAIRRQARKAKNVLWDVLRYGTYREKPAFEAAVDEVLASVSSEREERSLVVTLTVNASQPELARDIANTVASAYISDSTARRAAYLAERQNYLAGQVTSAQERLAAIRAAQGAYQREQGIVGEADQVRVAITSADQIERDLRATEAALSEAQARLDPVVAQIDGLPERILASTASTTPGDVTTETTTPHPLRVELETARLSIEREIASLGARRDVLAAALEGKQQETRGWIDKSSRLQDLQLEERLASGLLEARQADLNNATLEANRPAESIRLIEEADAPLYPASPLKVMWVGAAIAVSLAVMILLAFVLDYTNLGVRSPQRLADIFEAPTLAVVSRGGDGGSLIMPSPRNGQSEREVSR